MNPKEGYPLREFNAITTVSMFMRKPFPNATKKSLLNAIYRLLSGRSNTVQWTMTGVNIRDEAGQIFCIANFTVDRNRNMTFLGVASLKTVSLSLVNSLRYLNYSAIMDEASALCGLQFLKDIEKNS